VRWQSGCDRFIEHQHEHEKNKTTDVFFLYPIQTLFSIEAKQNNDRNTACICVACNHSIMRDLFIFVLSVLAITVSSVLAQSGAPIAAASNSTAPAHSGASGPAAPMWISTSMAAGVAIIAFLSRRIV
jgi:hypothetical protein